MATSCMRRSVAVVVAVVSCLQLLGVEGLPTSTNTAPASEPNAPSIHNDAASLDFQPHLANQPGQGSAPYQPKPLPVHEVAPPIAPSPASSDPFTNHFVLDTANLDLDGDGCIAGEAELDLFKYHVATAMSGNPDNMLRAHSIVHRTDVNRDGRICWCDFISIYLHDRNQAVNDRHRAAPFLVMLDKESGMFARLDVDGDGKLKGPELQGLVRQFSSCLAEDQAQLIVAAITGLEEKDNALSKSEFARFLGAEPKPETLQQTGATGSIPANPEAKISQQLAAGKSKISRVVLTSTPAPTSAPPSQAGNGSN